jgi:hypothetical protein
MEIPLQAQGECTDGVCGVSVFVQFNPVSDQVTHPVMREANAPHTEYIVPVDLISETIANTIQLNCSKAELNKMDPFLRICFIQERVPDLAGHYGGGEGVAIYTQPYVTLLKTVYGAVEEQQIPPGELAVRHGTRVEATDGYVGHVDEFVINAETSHITHLVMREGHLWGQKDVIFPVSAMGETHDDTVFLKIAKRQVESLPTFPLHRRWA